MNQYDERDDPIFTFDKVMGDILHALAVVGAFCAFIAVCFFWGYLT